MRFHQRVGHDQQEAEGTDGHGEEIELDQNAKADQHKCGQKHQSGANTDDTGSQRAVGPCGRPVHRSPDQTGR